MSESSRRIRAASRQATTAIEGFTESDVAWAEVRTIALMIEGVVFVEAVLQASRECGARILERQLRAIQDLEAMRRRQRDETAAKREAEETERRSRLEGRATLGQRPSLKASLGDLLAARERTR
jgi:hypothetical protein